MNTLLVTLLVVAVCFAIFFGSLKSNSDAKKAYENAPIEHHVAKVISKEVINEVPKKNFESYYGFVTVRNKCDKIEKTYVVSQVLYHELVYGIEYKFETKLNRILSAKETNNPDNYGRVKYGN